MAVISHTCVKLKAHAQGHHVHMRYLQICWTWHDSLDTLKVRLLAIGGGKRPPDHKCDGHCTVFCLQVCHVKNKDIRKFLDGVYVEEKGFIVEPEE